MKRITILFTLLVSTVMFSSPSYSEWTKVSENVGATFYVDFERIRKVDGYVYYWEMGNLKKPSSQGDLSVKQYNQGDCKLFRVKRVTASYHTQPMGEGIPSATGATKNQQWAYPPPNSVNELILKSACSR